MNEPDLDNVKPLFWIGGSRSDLREFPPTVREVMGFALYQAQRGGKHVSAKPLKGFGGAGVLEVVADEKGNTFRAVYTIRFANAVYVLDAFQKKSKKGAMTPQRNTDRIKNRLAAARRHYAAWRHEQGADSEE